MSILDFLLKAYELKDLRRKGWIKKVGVENPESVASHTFGMLLLSLLFYDDIDLFKSIIIHDLAEVVIGDLTPEEKTEELKRKEEEAYSELVSKIGTRGSKELFDLFKKSKNSEILKELDKLDLALQALYYKIKGYPRERLEEFILSSEAEIKSPRLKKLFDEIKARFYS